MIKEFNYKIYHKILNIIISFALNRSWFIISVLFLLSIFFGYRVVNMHIPPAAFSYRALNSSMQVNLNSDQENKFNTSNILLLVEGSEKNMKLFANDLKHNLEIFDNWIYNVHTQFPIDFYRKNKFKLLSLERLESMVFQFKNPNILPYLKSLNVFFEDNFLRKLNILEIEENKLQALKILDALEIFIDIKKEFISKSDVNELGQKTIDALIFGESYMLSLDKNMMLVIIEPQFHLRSNLNQIKKQLTGIENIINKSKIKYNVEADMAGPLIFSKNESRIFKDNIKIFSMVVILMILFVMIIISRDIALSFTIIMSIICSQIWFLGLSSFIINSLSLISIFISMISIVLNMDYVLNIFFTYNKLNKSELNSEKLFSLVFKKSFNPIIVTSLLISFALLPILFSNYNELRSIVSLFIVSIFTTMLCNILLIPTMLVINRSLFKYQNTYLMFDYFFDNIIKRIIFLLNKYRRIVILIFCICTLTLFKSSLNTFTNYSHLSLVDYNIDTLGTEHKIENAFNISSDYISLISNELDEARNLAEKARALETIGKVESITDYLPYPDILEEQFRLLKKINRDMLNSKLRKYMSSYDVEIYQKEMQRLEANIIDLQDMDTLNGEIYNKAIRLVGEINDSLNIGNLTSYVSSLDSNFTKIELTYFQQQFSKALKSSILNLTNTEVLGIKNLPIAIKQRFTKETKYGFITRIYPKKNIFHDKKYDERFYLEVKSLNADINNYPIFISDFFRIFIKDFRVLLFSVMIALGLLFLYFKNIKYPLISLSLVIIVFIWTWGVMGLNDLNINLINILIIPIIVVIIITNIIRLFDNYNNDNINSDFYGAILKAMLVSLILTMLCFGSLNFAIYRVFVLLGQTLFISLSICYAILFLISPCIFNLGKKHSYIDETV